MEMSCSRFTPAEGGARLAAVASIRNTLTAEYGSFIATRLIQEDGYKIRGYLSDGKQRSIYICRASRVACTAYDLRILTELKITEAVTYEQVYDWWAELETKQVLVCTSLVLKKILKEEILKMENINVMVIDSSHLVFIDENLQFIMKVYKESDVNNRPRILALTYPLFSSMKKDSKLTSNDAKDTKIVQPAISDKQSENNAVEQNEIPENESVDQTEAEEDTRCNFKKQNQCEEFGVFENVDDFNFYEKLEWKIDMLEEALCCKMDLAEDIDGGKRLISPTSKPKELIIEYAGDKTDNLSDEYKALEQYMRSAVTEGLDFLNDHRYDPTEIYGEDLYEEFANIPNPTTDPKTIFKQFLYILDELGPYGADKAAFSLLTKLEKLKIKVPYERHFLLLCVCTSVLVKIRSYVDYIFSKYDSDWEKIQLYSTPKVLRFGEILEKFQPPDLIRDIQKNCDPTNIDDNTKENNKNILKNKNKIIDEIDKLDFKGLGDRIEDQINVLQGNLKELVIEDNDNKLNVGNKNDLDNSKSDIQNDSTDIKVIKSDPGVIKDVLIQSRSVLGFQRRNGQKSRGRGRVQRNNAARLMHLQQNPDALCGIVFMQDPLMAKIMFMVIADMSRSRRELSFLSAQYCIVQKPESGAGEMAECQKNNKAHEDVLKKFRMHESNLLLTTPALEEGIDLPRCNLVVRWDEPTSYRSHSLCSSRARCARASCVLLTRPDANSDVLKKMAVYTQLDQIIGKKCGCGVQDEPTIDEENYADQFNSIVKPYTPAVIKTDIKNNVANKQKNNLVEDEKRKNSFSKHEDLNDDKIPKDTSEINIENTVEKSNKQDIINNMDKLNAIDINPNISVQVTCDTSFKRNNDSDLPASVDLSSSIALINRYCGKLPSDTFTRLAPQWWMEEVNLQSFDNKKRKAFICTIRLPLNCPIKYNIVGHPMPTRVLARRMVALQACRILHKSGELDDQLMPIGKENFKACELTHSVVENDPTQQDRELNPRPGSTKRRQYYYKRTAEAFTDCEPVVDFTDEEIYRDMDNPSEDNIFPPKEVSNSNCKQDNAKENTLYIVGCTLWCALPERYNTRGRRLHAPQLATTASALLMYTHSQPHRIQIPSFPVYTRSGEVRVKLQHVADADCRVSPRRVKLLRRFMKFVFAEVLRVRRRGMNLQSDGSNNNNYYVVPTIKNTLDDGSIKFNIDWPFLELIYHHTEENRKSEIHKPLSFDNSDGQGQKDSDDYSENELDGNVSNMKDSNAESLNVNTKECSRNELRDNLVIDAKQTIDLNQTANLNVKTNVSTIISTNKQDNEKHSNIEKGNDPEKVNQCITDNVIDKDLNHEKIIDDNTNEENIVNVSNETGETNDKKVKILDNPLLRKGEMFFFDAEKYKEAVVTPWYRNQDQPQFFLVAEICWNLTPDSGFPSGTHTSFRSYYTQKYGVTITQPNQPLLDVDHTSARLNLLTPRYVNRKGVALPVSSERTRRAKRDRLDQKQILVPELCRIHPFAAPLWFATVALPCILYRINALLIADEIRRTVAIDVGLGIPRIDETTCPDFQWPALDFGWSLAEVLNADQEKNEKKKEIEDTNSDDKGERDKNITETEITEQKSEPEANESENVEAKEKTINEILQEKEDAESGFEIGTWSNEMASSIPDSIEYDEFMEPFPSNLTFCTSVSGGANWCDPVQKPKSQFQPSRNFSMAESDCSYMSSDFDTDDSDLESAISDDDTDTTGFCSSKNSNAAMGVRIEYKTTHEAEAIDVEQKEKLNKFPEPDPLDDAEDLKAFHEIIRSGVAPKDYIETYHKSVEKHIKQIIENGNLIKQREPLLQVLPEIPDKSSKYSMLQSMDNGQLLKIFELFPYSKNIESYLEDGQISLENIEKNKRITLEEAKQSLTDSDKDRLSCFTMVDVNIDAPDYVNEKIANVGFDSKEKYINKLVDGVNERKFDPYYLEGKMKGKEFDFDFQPSLEGHPGPSPSLILQALTMSNANDGINLERLETIGDSFLKFAITAYLYCAEPSVHEGKLSHVRSKQVSNLNLYRLGRNKRLGGRMIASKFEPHDNWLPPCHKAPAAHSSQEKREAEPKTCEKDEQTRDNTGCFIPYNLITQHSIPDKSIADCVEALIGAYLLECGPRGALLFMSWLGVRVLPAHVTNVPKPQEQEKSKQKTPPRSPKHVQNDSDSDSDSNILPNGRTNKTESKSTTEDEEWRYRAVGALRPRQNENGQWTQTIFGELKAPPSPLLRYVQNPEGELEKMLSGYDELERTLQYRFNDRSLLLQALTHASHQTNVLTDCYQRLELLGDAILDYLITRYLYEDPRRHSPGALTDLRSALVNNTIFATLAARHGFHKFFRHLSPGLNEVLTKYVKIQEENGHSISEEHYLIQEDEMEQAEDVEVPKALGDLFESVAGAIFLDSGLSLSRVWAAVGRLIRMELAAFSALAPKSPVRELLEARPDTAKFGKPERLADGRRVRVCVEVFGRGTFKGIGRNYRIAKGTAARCALRHLRTHPDRYSNNTYNY